MPSNNASFGVFPSQSAIRSKSTPELQRLYFRTSAAEEFAWRTIPEADRPENFDAIHNIGKRTTKYMKYQRKVAPLVDRTACRYSMDYTPMPLGDNIINAQLAATYAQGKMVQASPSLAGKSNYAETFCQMTPEQMRSAKQKSRAPKEVRTKTLGGTEDFLEVESLMHNTYQTPNLELAKVTPAMVPRANLTMSGLPAAEQYATTYGRGFSQPAPRAKLEPANAFIPERSPYVLAADEVYRTRRACYLSPGC